MARKGQQPLAKGPPPAASTSDEDAATSSSDDDEEQQSPPHQPPPPKPLPDASSSSEEDPDEDVEEEEEKEKPTKAIRLRNPPPSSSNSTSSSDSDSPVKPKSKTKPIPTVAALAAKRPPPTPTKPSPSPSKKPKKDNSTPQPSTVADSSKKALFQRFWSEDDEIVILKGMIDFKAKKGVDPMSDPDGFLDFINNSLHVVDAKKDQVVNKVRRLKKKFLNAKKKKITNPHDLSVFDLSRKIWDGAAAADNAIVTAVKTKTIAADNAAVTVVKTKTDAADNAVKSDAVTVAKSNGKVRNDAKLNGEVKSVEKRGVRRCESAIRVEELGKFWAGDVGIVKEGLRLLGEGEREELEEEWRKVNVAEMEVFTRKLELYRDMVSKALNAYKSATH